MKANKLQTFWEMYKKREKRRFITIAISIPILIPIFILMEKYHVSMRKAVWHHISFRIIEWKGVEIPIDLILAILFVLIFIGLVIHEIHFQLWQNKHKVDPTTLAAERAKAEEWKRKIRSVADNIDMPKDDVTFDDVCESCNDEALEQIFNELKRMPTGKRIFRNAFEKVLPKVA